MRQKYGFEFLLITIALLWPDNNCQLPETRAVAAFDPG